MRGRGVKHAWSGRNVCGFMGKRMIRGGRAMWRVHEWNAQGEENAAGALRSLKRRHMKRDTADSGYLHRARWTCSSRHRKGQQTCSGYKAGMYWNVLFSYLER